MLGRVVGYPDSVLESLDQPRFRDLLRGVQVAAVTPEVAAAFEILYEDYIPIRTAGKFIFESIDKQVQCAADRVAELCQSCDIDEECLVASLEVFQALDLNGDGSLSASEVEECCLLQSLPAVMPGGSLEMGTQDLLEKLDKDADGRVTYLEFLEGSLALFGGELGGGQKAAEYASSFMALRDSLRRQQQEQQEQGEGGQQQEQRRRQAALAAPPPPPPQGGMRGLTLRRSKGDPGARFDKMLRDFAVWEKQLMPPTAGSGTGDDESGASGGEASGLASIRNPRLRTVLEGCFVGARTPGVISALRIVYEDYRPLRLGGDLIFNLMAALIEKPKQ